MSDFLNGAAYLPPAIREIVVSVPLRVQDMTQEIRMRAGAAVSLSTPAGELLVTKTGQVTELGGEKDRLLYCDAEQLFDCFQRLCEYSVHTHQQELREGYISTRTGCRAGVAGSVVTERGEILSMRQITSICIRIARPHDGCATALAAELVEDGRIRSALLVGEPSSGKTSLLRDLARQLSGGRLGRRYRTVVVDERGELAAEGGLADCDVLLHCPKGAGIQQAVRCLAPDVVIFDELGTEEEVQAVLAGMNTGVTVIASAHCRDLISLLRRPPIRHVLEAGAFDSVVMLEGRRSPGNWKRIYSWEELVGERNRTAAARRIWSGSGRICSSRPEPAGIRS